MGQHWFFWLPHYLMCEAVAGREPDQEGRVAVWGLAHGTSGREAPDPLSPCPAIGEFIAGNYCPIAPQHSGSGGRAPQPKGAVQSRTRQVGRHRRHLRFRPSDA